MNLVYFNTGSTLWLSASVTSAYYGITLLKGAVSKLLQLPFGSRSVSDRVDQVVKETLEGKLSIRDFLFGGENKKERLYEFITGSVQLAKSVALLVFAYFCYYESQREFKIDYQQIETCNRELEVYNQEFNQTQLKYDFWMYNLCEFDQMQWEDFVPRTQMCFQNSYFTYDGLEGDCRQDFAELTYLSHMKDIAPKDKYHAAAKRQRSLQKKALDVCDGVLFRTESLVNEKCNYLNPYIGIQAKAICTFVQNAPFIEVSSGCMEACEVHQENYDRVYGQLKRKIPQTEDIEIECHEVLSNEKPQPINSTSQNRQGMTRTQIIEKIHSILSQIRGDWRNASAISMKNKQTVNIGWRASPRHEPEESAHNPYYITLLKRVLQDVRSKAEYEDFIRLFRSSFSSSELETLMRNKDKILL